MICEFCPNEDPNGTYFSTYTRPGSREKCGRQHTYILCGECTKKLNASITENSRLTAEKIFFG